MLNTDGSPLTVRESKCIMIMIDWSVRYKISGLVQPDEVDKKHPEAFVFGACISEEEKRRVVIRIYGAYLGLNLRCR